MDKTYTFTEIVREFNFDGDSTKKLFTAKGVKPSRVMKIGKREVVLYGPTAYAVAKAERERRDAERAAKGRKSPAANLKKNAPKDYSKLEEAYWKLSEQLEEAMAGLGRIEEMVKNIPPRLAGMEARLMPKTYVPYLTQPTTAEPVVTPSGTGTDPNALQSQTLAMLDEMAATTDD